MVVVVVEPTLTRLFLDAGETETAKHDLKGLRDANGHIPLSNVQIELPHINSATGPIPFSNVLREDAGVEGIRDTATGATGHIPLCNVLVVRCTGSHGIENGATRDVPLANVGEHGLEPGAAGDVPLVNVFQR